MKPLLFFRKNPVIKLLVVVNISVYFFEILPALGNFLIELGSLIPREAFTHVEIWRFVTYMFLHDPLSPFHLLFNMLALWMFGDEIEELFGSVRFAWFYAISGIGAGCFSILYLFSPSMRSIGVIGASGAVLSVMTVYAAYYPHRNVLLFFILPVNIRIVIVGYALISLFGSISSAGVVAHLTHLGGIIVAICYLKWYPFVSGWVEDFIESRKENSIRRRLEASTARKNFFEKQIDPILEKISREGMDSLTKQEKNLLKKVASKNRDILTKEKIIPLEPFK